MNAVDHVLMKISKRRFQMSGSGKGFGTLHICGPQGNPIAFPIAAQFTTCKSLDFYQPGGCQNLDFFSARVVELVLATSVSTRTVWERRYRTIGVQAGRYSEGKVPQQVMTFEPLTLFFWSGFGPDGSSAGACQPNSFVRA